MSARILVIDDEPQIRRFLGISLRALGYTVVEAADGQAGLAALATGGADAVVLDLGLPDRDGRDVLRDLRTWSSVPVIVLSVRSQEGEKVALLDAGANDYLSKPFGVQELAARIRVLLRAERDQEPAEPLELGDLADRHRGAGQCFGKARRSPSPGKSGDCSRCCSGTVAGS